MIRVSHVNTPLIWEEKQLRARPSYAKLLKETQIYTIENLSKCNAEKRYNKITEDNATKKKPKKLPTQDEILKWIVEAKKINPITPLENLSIKLKKYI